LVFATDLGYIPRNVPDHLRGCSLLLIESNHDVEMLRSGPYPWSVKQRVMSRVGHLSNDALAEFFSNDYDGGAEYIFWRISLNRITIPKELESRPNRRLPAVRGCGTTVCCWQPRRRFSNPSGYNLL